MQKLLLLVASVLCGASVLNKFQNKGLGRGSISQQQGIVKDSFSQQERQVKDSIRHTVVYNETNTRLSGRCWPDGLERVTPATPEEDPFYEEVENLESFERGQLIRFRRVPFPIAWVGKVKVNIVDAIHIAYRSDNTFGKPIMAVSTILIPHNVNKSQVISYQYAIDSSSVSCAPSYMLMDKLPAKSIFDGLEHHLESLVFFQVLEMGWVVTVPDYLGPKASFMASKLAAHVVIDGVRATLASTEITGVDPNADIVALGYSGGSLAIGYSSSIMNTYGAGLNFKGMVLGATLPDLTILPSVIDGGPYFGMLLMALNGLSTEFPELIELRGMIKPQFQSYWEKSQRECLLYGLTDGVGYKLEEVLHNVSQVINSPSLKHVLELNSQINQERPNVPMLIYHSKNDELAFVNETDTMVSKFCEMGATIEYRRERWGVHLSTGFAGYPGGLLWLKDRLAGIPPKPGCQTVEVSSLLQIQGAWHTFLSLNFNLFLGLAFKKPIGLRWLTGF